MARFTPGVDTEVRSDEPLLEVAVTRETPLAIGQHVFRLIVQDDAGNDSAPATVTIIVQDTERPTAVILTIDATGGRNPEPTVSMPFGSAFSLTGERSSDIGGQVRAWNWALVRI